MPQFDVKEYKKHLLESDSFESCEKVPSPELGESTRYIFISYSHRDYKQVYCDLAELYHSDIPFWYDGGLPAGKNWDDVVREKMTNPNCAGVIFYLSEHLFLSRSIQTEIQIAIGKDPEGEGVIRYPDGSSYDGQIKNNLRHGWGTYTLADGTVQAGLFENDVFVRPAE